MTPAQFRSALFASVVIGLVGGVADLAVPGLVPDHLAAEAMQYDQVTSGMGLALFGALLLIAFAGGIVAVIGLWFSASGRVHWRWSQPRLPSS